MDTKKVIASGTTDGVDALEPLAEEFMETIFGLAPGTYYITDESRLCDFTSFVGGEPTLGTIIQKVSDTYHLSVIPNNLLALLRELQYRSRH